MYPTADDGNLCMVDAEKRLCGALGTLRMRSWIRAILAERSRTAVKTGIVFIFANPFLSQCCCSHRPLRYTRASSPLPIDPYQPQAFGFGCTRSQRMQYILFSWTRFIFFVLFVSAPAVERTFLPRGVMRGPTWRVGQRGRYHLCGRCVFFDKRDSVLFRHPSTQPNHFAFEFFLLPSRFTAFRPQRSQEFVFPRS